MRTINTGVCGICNAAFTRSARPRWLFAASGELIGAAHSSHDLHQPLADDMFTCLFVDAAAPEQAIAYARRYVLPLLAAQRDASGTSS